MSAAAPRLYRLDFAGKHTIATGMLNTALTAVSAAVVAHVATATGAVSVLQAALSLAAVTILGVMMTLVWGAFSPKAPHAGTIAHRIACWIGAGAWTSMLAFREWSLNTLISYGAVLAAIAAVAGFVGWLRTPVLTPEGTAAAAQRQEEKRQQLIRDDLAEEWRDRILRVVRLTVDIPAIEDYPIRTSDGRQIGYTLEVHLPVGGSSGKTLQRSKADLENDKSLPPGCDIVVRMGRNRRIALMDVTIVNVLDEEQYYPTDYSPLSVLEPLPMMVNRRGSVHGPVLREQNCGIFGEGGSGKSNTGQVIGAGVARMVDAHLCDIDTTGIRLSMPLIRPYLEGRVQTPAVFWAAWNLSEAILLLRALDRAALARNKGYNDLKLSVGDDKMPISSEFPAFLVRCDEIKSIASISADPVAYTFLRKITDDHRDAGIRAVLLGLRGTNDIISQGVQAQLHNLGVLKAQSKAEYVAVFGGQATGIDPSDAPYPGCIQMRLGSSNQIQPYHVWRLVGKQIDNIAVAVADYQPGVDALTWLALNGRDAHGKPFADLLPGELDCCATRWDRFRKTHGYQLDDQSDDQDPTDTGQSPGMAGQTKTVSQVQEEIAEAVRRVQEAIVKRQQQTERDAENLANIEETIRNADLDGELAKIFGHDIVTGPDPMDGFNLDVPTVKLSTEPSTSGVSASPPVVDNFAVISEIVVCAGEIGIEMSAIHKALAERGIVVDRATVHKWLKAMILPSSTYKDQIEWRPDRPEGRNGRWYPKKGDTQP
jgi:hypothetical protein